jgi:predicted RNA-binding protein YlxR (DUF448 family)
MGMEAKRGRHVPERSCIACRRKRPKWELVRIVRTSDGAVEIDVGGKKAGRGAYLCRLQECSEVALKKKRVERALRAEITPHGLSELQALVTALPSEDCGGQAAEGLREGASG